MNISKEKMFKNIQKKVAAALLQIYYGARLRKNKISVAMKMMRD